MENGVKLDGCIGNIMLEENDFEGSCLWQMQHTRTKIVLQCKIVVFETEL